MLLVNVVSFLFLFKSSLPSMAKLNNCQEHFYTIVIEFCSGNDFSKMLSSPQEFLWILYEQQFDFDMKGFQFFMWVRYFAHL